MFFLKIETKKALIETDVLTLQQNVLSKNFRRDSNAFAFVLTLQQNVLSKNLIFHIYCLSYVLTLQQNVLSKNIIDIAI